MTQQNGTRGPRDLHPDLHPGASGLPNGLEHQEGQEQTDRGGVASGTRGGASRFGGVASGAGGVAYGAGGEVSRSGGGASGASEVGNGASRFGGGVSSVGGGASEFGGGAFEASEVWDGASRTGGVASRFGGGASRFGGGASGFGGGASEFGDGASRAKDGVPRFGGGASGFGGGASELGAAPDGGWGWVVLAANILVLALTLAFPSCVGIFYTDLQNEFQASNSQTSWVPSIMTSMLHAGGVLVDRTGQYFFVFVVCSAVVASSAIFLMVSFYWLDEKERKAESKPGPPNPGEPARPLSVSYRSLPTEGDREGPNGEEQTSV
ncbi:unnamed protein product [Menidia menidia]|uniref:(Atlantic silverside) hypothetical protein n=1 Tax=Menidia menidia TaxID=238744 RepID=A0A8S4B241_9TELE|nr:unnamed protein product [Menidia menidia]